MLPTHLRDQTAQRRAASLRMNAQSRLASASARGPVASSPSGPKPSTRFRTRGGAGATSKGLKTAVARSELDDELREARAERSSSDNDSPEAAPVEGKLVRAAGKENAVEVPLELLVVPGRRSTASDYEIITKCKGVIALDDRDFGTSSSPELGAAQATSEAEDDEWELLGLEDQEMGVKDVKPQAKSWASIVGRA